MFLHEVSISAVLMEDLAGYRPVSQLLSAGSGSDTEIAELLLRTIPVFVELYAKGCNHIDVNRDAAGETFSAPEENRWSRSKT